MKDKIFELVAKGYEVNFRRGNPITGAVTISLRKKNYQNNTMIDRVLDPDEDMLLWTLDKLEKSFGSHCEPMTPDDRQMVLVKLAYPKSEYIERYFDAHKIRYTVKHDPGDYHKCFGFIYECKLTTIEFEELQTFLDIIK